MCRQQTEVTAGWHAGLSEEPTRLRQRQRQVTESRRELISVGLVETRTVGSQQGR
jgi:hypothetical protein